MLGVRGVCERPADRPSVAIKGPDAGERCREMTSRYQKLGYGAAVMCAALLTPSGTAQAEGPYEGMWDTGPTRVSVSVQSWGEDCGTRPRSDIQPAGGAVRITQSGHHLIIHSRGGTVRSDACWSPNPALRRASSSFLDGVWTILCNTPPDDPKSESGEYSLTLEGNDVLQYKDVSRYNWELKESTCVATIITTQTLTRVRSETAAKTEPKPAPLPVVAEKKPVVEKEPGIEEPEKPDGTCQPGAPERLVLQPKRADIEPGQRVCFRARVVDSAGCTVPGQSFEWTLGHAPGLRGALQDGCFRAASSAAEAEGEFRVVASSANLRSQALVSVKPVDLSDLIAKRIEGGAVSGFDRQEKSEPASEKAEEGASLGIEVGEGGGSGMLPLAIAAISVLGLAALALVFRLRRKPSAAAFDPDARQHEAEPPAWGPAPEAPPVSTPPAVAAAAGEQWICPACRRGYPRDKGVCPSDGTALVPYEQFARQHRERQDGSKKMRCPKCGEIYPSTVTFCGKDGAALEPVS
jgi:hypothetical protein